MKIVGAAAGLLVAARLPWVEVTFPAAAQRLYKALCAPRRKPRITRRRLVSPRLASLRLGNPRLGNLSATRKGIRNPRMSTPTANGWGMTLDAMMPAFI